MNKIKYMLSYLFCKQNNKRLLKSRRGSKNIPLHFISCLLLLLIISFTACEVEDGEYNRKTLQGQIAFNKVQGYLSDPVILLDMMGRVDYYARAEEDKKEGIKNYYLHDYKIESNETTWTLKSNKVEIIFMHNKKSINEEGAIWTASLTFTDGQYKEEIVTVNNFRLLSTGDKSWSITVTDMIRFYSLYDNTMYFTNKEEKNSGSYTVKATYAADQSPYIYDYKIEGGSGKIASEPDFEYWIKKTFVYFYLPAFSSTTLTEGDIEIKAGEKDDIFVNVSLKDSYPVYKITFNGITEDYWGYGYWY